MERKQSVSVRFWSLVIMSLLIPLGCGVPSGSSDNSGHGGNSAGAGGKAGSGAGGTSANGGSAAGGNGSGGRSSAGGNPGDGGASTGETSGGGGSAGGSGGKGGSRGTAGGAGSGGTAGGGTAGSAGAGGRSNPGGQTGFGGSAGAAGGAAGNAGAGGGAGAGEKGGAAGSAGAGGVPSTDCSITIISGDISPKMATVGVVEWSTTLSNLASAQIVYTLNNAGSSILNKGGTAPVDLKKTNYHTLLLGLKPSSTYTFHVEATSSSGGTCKGSDKTLTTGALSGAPTITRTATSSTAQAGGFIVTSTGQAGGGFGGGGSGSGSNGAYIVDADGTVVWYGAAPNQCSRARMDYEGANMWMLALNVQNTGGEMRFLSMDGVTSKTSISGLSSAHHDFAVLPGKIAAMVWVSTGTDPESNLVEIASDGSGSATTAFKIGSNLYAGGASAFGGGGGNTYHCNYIIYHPADDSFTISDRNPNLVVKVNHDGTPVWQIGGSCTNAKAPKCASGTWQVNHGHDLDGNGNMMLFNNGQSGSSHVFDFKVSETATAISYTTNKDFTSSNNSNVMGDVQYLPNGNRLITYSTAGVILEVDPSWGTVQTLKGSVGYADWRPTLYGPPTRK